jgi:hypothetical protein
MPARQRRIILCPCAPPSVLPDISPSRGLLRNGVEGLDCLVGGCMGAGFAVYRAVAGAIVRFLVDCGRSYGVIAAQRRMLKPIAARVIWALALTRPT